MPRLPEGGTTNEDPLKRGLRAKREAGASGRLIAKQELRDEKQRGKIDYDYDYDYEGAGRSDQVELAAEEPLDAGTEE